MGRGYLGDMNFAGFIYSPFFLGSEAFPNQTLFTANGSQIVFVPKI